MSIEKLQTLIEKEIARTPFGKQPPTLYEPIRYLMSLGGKRLRPLLVLMAYGIYKKDFRSIAKYAIAVEAFHNFTLMHDDIMDNAPLRRGNVTVHEKWNVNTAILSGDVMLVRVYEMLSTLDPMHLPEVLKVFSQCASEVCEGQQLDMDFEHRMDVSATEYLQMIRKKTAVLLGFSLELGAILSNASGHDRKLLRDFGINVGIGFQLKDDLLDAYADPKKFGKQVGGDILANKKTYLLILALQLAKGKQQRELQFWMAAKKYKKQEKIESVKSIFDELSIPELTDRKIKGYFNKGLTTLDVLGSSQDVSQLKTFAIQLISRQS